MPEEERKAYEKEQKEKKAAASKKRREENLKNPPPPKKKRDKKYDYKGPKVDAEGNNINTDDENPDEQDKDKTVELNKNGKKLTTIDKINQSKDKDVKARKMMDFLNGSGLINSSMTPFY